MVATKRPTLRAPGARLSPTPTLGSARDVSPGPLRPYLGAPPPARRPAPRTPLTPPPSPSPGPAPSHRPCGPAPVALLRRNLLHPRRCPPRRSGALGPAIRARTAPGPPDPPEDPGGGGYLGRRGLQPESTDLTRGSRGPQGASPDCGVPARSAEARRGALGLRRTPTTASQTPPRRYRVEAPKRLVHSSHVQSF